MMARRAVTLLTLFAAVGLGGCAQCDSCKRVPGWDGRYAGYERGPIGEGRQGLPATPYVPR